MRARRQWAGESSGGRQGTGAPGRRTRTEQVYGGQRKARVDGFDPGTAPPRDTAAHEPIARHQADAFGKALGAELGGVVIHRGDGVAEDHGAAAITFGADIHFADGMHGAGGGGLLGHELVHTVQQGAVPVHGGAPTHEGSTASAEAEADAAGAAAARGEAAPVRVGAPGGAQRKPAANTRRRRG